MPNTDDIRDAVASALEASGFNNGEFLRQIRAGDQDDGPYMLGAFACATLLQINAPARSLL